LYILLLRFFVGVVEEEEAKEGVKGVVRSSSN
jgi:hypothetical protein